MRSPLPLLVLPALAKVLTASIAVILLASNFTIINAQQQGEQLTSQPGEIGNRTTATTTTFQNATDGFSIQFPDGWVIQDIDNTGSAFLQERTQGYGVLAQLCPEEQQQQARIRGIFQC